MGDDDDGLAPRPRCRASQSTPSTSRWLVGSSSTSRSCSPTSSAGRARPGAARRPRAGRPARSSTDVLGGRPPTGPSSTSRTRGPRPTRGPGASPSTVPDGRRRVEVVVLGEQPDPQAAGVGDPAGVRRAPAGSSTRSRVVLPSPLRPTTPIRSPSPTPRETASSSTVGAVRLGTALEVDQVGALSAADRWWHRRARRGPGPWRASRAARRLAVSATAMSMPCSGLARKAQVGPEPETMPPSAPSLQPRASVSPQLGSQRARRRPAGRCASARPSRRIRPAQGGHHRVGDRRLRDVGRRAAGRARRRPPASTGRPRRGRHPHQAAAGEHRREALAAPGATAVPPSSANGTSLPSSAASSAARRGTARGPTARRRRPAGGAASAVPPAMPPATGMPLRMQQRARRLDGRVARRAAGGPQREVVSSAGTPSAGTRGVDGDDRSSSRRRRDLVVEADRVEDGGQVVVAVRRAGRRRGSRLTFAARARSPIDGGGAGGAPRTGRPPPTAGRRADQAAAIGRSPRRSAPRRAPAGRRPAGAARPRPRPASRPSAASAAAQRLAALREGGVDHGEDLLAGGGRRRGSRRVQATSPESTLGAGQNTLRADRAGPAHVGVPGGLHRRHAVRLRARGGGQPVGDLGLHHDQPRAQAWEALAAGAAAPAPRRCRAGWRPARWAAVRAARRRAARRPATTSSRSACAGRVPPRWPAAGRPAPGRPRPRRPARRPRAGRGSATRARPDLDDHVVGADAGGAHDPAHRVGVDDEVLPALLGGVRSSSAASRTDLRRPKTRAGMDMRYQWGRRTARSRRKAEGKRRRPARRRSRLRRRAPWVAMAIWRSRGWPGSGSRCRRTPARCPS